MRLAIMAVATVALIGAVQEAEARAGRGFSKNFSRSPAASQTAPAARRTGIAPAVVVPLGLGRASGHASSPDADATAPAHSAVSDGADGRVTGSVAAVPEQPVPAESGARPWCEDTYVVGRGAGFCVVAPRPGLQSAALYSID